MDSSTTKEPFAFGSLPCHSQIVQHAFDHHLMFREKRLRGQPLPSGARNLEDTGARTKSPLSGAGKTKPKIQTAPMGICDFGDFQMEKSQSAERWCFLFERWKLVFVQSFDFACQRNVTIDVSMGEYDENM